MTADSMEEQVKLLVALQDLDLMLKEAKDADTSSEMKQMGFKFDGITELMVSASSQKIAGRHAESIANEIGNTQDNDDGRRQFRAGDSGYDSKGCDNSVNPAIYEVP